MSKNIFLAGTLAAILLVASCTPPLEGGTSGEIATKEIETVRESVTITGRIAVIGNEPFTRLALITEDNQVYELEGEKVEELRALQGETIQVTARLLEERGYYAQKLEVISYETKQEAD